ncbi:hypothetical protein APHAL10511_003482 [Amanita phalloides]|nr:hypothetical protein APHAL10511_003482 [Amanita phalloides]
MTTLRVRFPYKEWPGWDVPECSLTCVQLPNTSDPPRKLVTATVDTIPFSDYCSDSPVFRATLGEHPRKLNVVLKFALREDLIPSLAEEACAYVGALKPLQGKTVPVCYGLYAGAREDGQMIACLVLEYWGQSLRQPFRRLPLNLKLDLPLHISFIWSHGLMDAYLHSSIRLKILHQLGELHRCGFHHGDFAERNILERNGDIRIIDFDEFIEHDCHCDMNFHPGEKTPDAKEFGCPHLWELCRYSMKIWDLSS